MERVYNFSPGPAVLPVDVLKTAAKQMENYDGCGMSVMEMSHRSKVFEEIIQETEALLRSLMAIPENYRVLFLQGGASSQFAMVPMNLLTKSKRADFVCTGLWAKRAIAECKKFGTANVVASSEDKVFNYIPALKPAKFDAEADYFHITLNNTIYGTKFPELPQTGDVPLVSDISSNILSEPIDVSRFGLLYAGAQKNMGPSGVTVVIIREDLIGAAEDAVPTMLNYKTHAENQSLYNTPPTYGIYVMMLVLRWLKDLGGVPAMAEINKEKAALLYDFLDNSTLFSPTVLEPYRSLMNIPFLLPSDQLNAQFIKAAADSGFVNLKGHRSVGGMRASIYNAMPLAGVQALVDFMKRFEIENQKN